MPFGLTSPAMPPLATVKPEGFAEPLEELRVGAVGPVPHDPEVVPAGDAVARTDDIDRQCGR